MCRPPLPVNSLESSSFSPSEIKPITVAQPKNAICCPRVMLLSRNVKLNTHHTFRPSKQHHINYKLEGGGSQRCYFGGGVACFNKKTGIAAKQ